MSASEPIAPAVKRRTRDPEGVRMRVLDAAMRAFAEHGYEGAALPAIARAAGTGSPLIVHHFGSKRGLWEAVFEHVSSGARGQLDAIASAPGSAADRLRAIIAFQVHFFATRPEIYRLLASEAHNRTERLQWICDRFAFHAFERVVGVIREAQAEGAVRPLSPERLRYAIIGVASIAAISAEYEMLTGKDACSPDEVSATIAFINDLLFVA